MPNTAMINRTHYHTLAHLRHPWLLRSLIALALAIVATATASAQTEFNLLNNQTITIDLCVTPDAVLYDNGGAMGEYSNSFDGGAVLMFSPGMQVRLTGNYNTESGYDYLNITDRTGATLLNVSGSGSIDILATNSPVYITFTTDYSSTRQGFEINIQLIGATGAQCGNTVEGLTVSNITTTQATLAWSSANSNTPYRIIYGDQSVAGITARTYTLTGLNPASYYDVVVLPDVDIASRCCADAVQFRTQCGTAHLPFSEGFENYAEDATPDCWRVLTNFDDEESQPRVVATQHSSGANSLMLSSGATDVAGHYGMVVAPNISGIAGSCRVSFNIMPSHSGIVLGIGTCDTSSSEVDEFDYVEQSTITLGSSGAWQTQTITWQPGADGRCLAFRLDQSRQYGIGRRVYIDDIGLDGCGVSNLQASNIEEDNFIFSWDNDGATSCTVGIHKLSAMYDDTTFANATSPLHITGLEAATDYLVTIYPYCANGPALSRNIIVSTAQQPQSAEDYCMMFSDDNHRLPTDWTFHNAPGNSFRADGSIVCPGYNTYMVSPRFSNLAGQTVAIRAMPYYMSSTPVYVIVGTMHYADDPTTFVPYDTVQIIGYYSMSYHNGGYVAFAHLPAGITDRYLAFKTVGVVYISSVQIGHRLVGDDHVVHARGTTAEIDFGAVYDTVIVRYYRDNYTNGLSAEDTFYNTQRGTLQNLSPNSNYYAVSYLPGASPCTDRYLKFSTVGRDFAMPYCDSITLGSDYFYYPYEGRTYSRGTYNRPRTIQRSLAYLHKENVLELGSWGFDYDYFSNMLMPDVVTDTGALLSFFAEAEKPNSKVAIGVLTYRNEIIEDSIRWIDTVLLTPTGTRRHYIVDLPDSSWLFDGVLMLSYWHENEYEFGSAYVENIALAKSAYGNMSVQYVGSDSAVLAFDTVAGADTLRLRIVGNGVVVLNVPAANIGHIEVPGLSPGTVYDVYATPLPGGCESFAGEFVTKTSNSGDCQGIFCHKRCHTFTDLLSYELPDEWAATTGYSITADDRLRIAAGGAVATNPIQSLDGYNLFLQAIGSQNADTLLVALMPQEKIPQGLAVVSMDSAFRSWLTVIDTIVVDTTLSPYAVALHPPANYDSLRLVLVATAGAVEFSNISYTTCPIVRFKTNGNSIICTTDADQGTDYMLNVYEQQGDTIGQLVYSAHVSSHEHIVQGLKLQSYYYVTYDCIFDEPICLPTYKVKTGGEVPLPYCLNYRDVDAEFKVPELWDFVSTSPMGGMQMSMYDPSLQLVPGDYYNWAYALLPPFHANSALSLNIQMYCNGTCEIGFLNNGNDTSSFIPIQTFYSQYVYADNTTFDFSQHLDKRIAIRVKHYNTDIYEIYVKGVPAVRERLVNYNTIELLSSVQTSYYAHFHTQPHTYDDTIVHVTSNPAYVTFNTHSYLHYAEYSDSTLNFCGARHSFRLSSQRSLPSCFSSRYAWNSLDFSYIGGEYHNPRSNDPGARFYVCEHTDDIEYIRTPDFDVDSIKNINISFVLQSTLIGDTLEVGVMYDGYDTATFIPVDTVVYTDQNNDWQRFNVSLASYRGIGRWLTFRHRSGQCHGCGEGGMLYIDSLTVDTCLSATATVSLSRWNVVRVDAAAPDGELDEPFLAVIRHQSSGTDSIVTIDSLPKYITLRPETEYTFRFQCEGSYSCRPVQYVKTHAAPLPVPTCVDFDTCAQATLPKSWNAFSSGTGVTNTIAHSDTNSLGIQLGTRAYVITPDIDIDSIGHLAISLWFKVSDMADRLVVGTTKSPNDPNSFHPLRTIVPTDTGVWQRAMVEFSNAPQDHHFVMFRARSNRSVGSRSVMIDDLYLSNVGAMNLRVQNVEFDAITLDWDQVGSPSIGIEVIENGTTRQVLTPTAPPYTIAGLNKHSYYKFRFVSQCDGNASYCTLDYTDSVSVVTPGEGIGCVNPTDLYAPEATFFSGTYTNPYSSSGAIDYGPLNPDSRHTVCYDTAERDMRTGGMLRTIPEGYTSSVRLGNWSTNAYNPEAEGVTYSLLVDTSSFNLLLMRYAAVLQDPMHAPADQPRFRLELLDSNFAKIDSACTSADFIANRNLGWNTASDGVLWKDWTSVGVDLAAHHGEQVYVRLTTFDCNEGNHYGYAYFTLECMRKQIATTACGDVDSNTLTAPAGFVYRWYNEQSNATIATTQSITIPSQDVNFLCDLSFVDNPSCQFTLGAYGGTRYPMASFDTSITIDSCHFFVQFTNTSAVSTDGSTPLAGTMCESAQWDYGNGMTSNSYHGSTVYMFPGTYQVRLITGIADGQCKDTAYMTLVLALPDGLLPMDTIDSTICSNQFVMHYGQRFDQQGMHYVSVPNAGTCDSVHFLDLTVNPSTIVDTVAVACDSMLWRGNTYYATTRDTTPPLGANSFGCDSVIALQLTVHYSDTADVVDTIVQNQLPYAAAGNNLTLADLPGTNPAVRQRLFNFGTQTSHGCDSTLNLQLTVWLNRDTTLYDTTCRNQLPYFYNGHSLTPSAASSTYHYTLQTTHGADSLVTLHLEVLPNPQPQHNDTIVQNQLPYTYRGYSFAQSTDTTLIVPDLGGGCDTIEHYTLHVWPNRDTTLYHTICANALPFVWEGHTFAETDIYTPTGNARLYTHTLVMPTTHGADSTLRLMLTVNPVYETVDTLIVCPYNRYVYRGVDYGGPAVFDTVLLTVADCDSLVHVVLRPRDTSFHIDVRYHFDSLAWQQADSALLGCAPTTLYLSDSTAHEYDRMWYLLTADTAYSTATPEVSLYFPQYSDSLSALVTIVAQSEGECWDTATYPVVIMQRPHIEFYWAPDIPAMHDPEVVFDNRSVPDSISFLWHIQRQEGGEFDTSTAFNPRYRWGEASDLVQGEMLVDLIGYWTHTIADSIPYADWVPVGLADSLGNPLTLVAYPVVHTCTDTAQNLVIISSDYLEFPNLVTPNGDGENDTWMVVNLVELGNYSQNELWIYDRWGVLVYHTTNIRSHSQDWDPNATSSPDGTYYYRFNARGNYGLIKRNGLIEVLRN